MIQSPKKWLNSPKGMPENANAGRNKPAAFFGYERISEDEKTHRVLQHFNSVARQYDFMNTLLSFGIHHIWKRIAVSAMGLSPGDQVIDVCGGTGDLAILAARHTAPQGRVVIFDINRDMMNAGRHKTSAQTLSERITYVQGNAEAISFPENTFEGAMVGFGIRNVTRMKKGFEEMHRVLKPGGKLMCLEFSKPTWPVFRRLYDIYSFHIMPFLGEHLAGSRQAYTHLPESIRTFPLPDELSDILSDFGFANVRYRKLTNGIAVIHTGVKRAVS